MARLNYYQVGRFGKPPAQYNGEVNSWQGQWEASVTTRPVNHGSVRDPINLKESRSVRDPINLKQSEHESVASRGGTLKSPRKNQGTEWCVGLYGALKLLRKS